jgi:hypothetical protein
LRKQVARNFMRGCGGKCTLLTIKTKTACDISSITFYSNEKESLLPPGTQLNVKSCKINGLVSEIALEEVLKRGGGRGEEGGGREGGEREGRGRRGRGGRGERGEGGERRFT